MTTGKNKGFVALLRANPAALAVCIATALSMLGQGVMSPVLPLFAKEFGVSAAVVGATVGIFGVGRLLANIPGGFLSQKFGRRLVMGSGLALAAVGSAMMGFSYSVGELIAWRFIAGIGGAFFTTGSFAYLADISTPENRGKFMSLQQGSLLIGVDIGPILGGLIADHIGFRWAFYLSGISMGVAALWTLSRLPDYKPAAESARPKVSETAKPKRSNDLHVAIKLLTNPTFLMVNIFTMIVFFTRTGTLQSIVPLKAEGDLSMSASQLGLLFSVSMAVNMMFVLPVGSLTDRIGRKAILLPGILLSVLSLLMFAMGSSVWMFFLAAIVYGMGVGIVGPAPAAYVGDLAPAGKTGITMGIYRSFGDLGFVFGPVLLGFIADRTTFSDAILVNSAMTMLVGLLMMLIAKETLVRKRHGKGDEAAAVTPPRK